jgi:hypothetical protein
MSITARIVTVTVAVLLGGINLTLAWRQLRTQLRAWRIRRGNLPTPITTAQDAREQDRHAQ